MLDNVEQVRTLIKRVEKEIEDRMTRKRNFKVLRSLSSLRIIKERLVRIESLLRIEKYDLVFIGEVGVGKTTTICHLLNLTRTAKKQKKLPGGSATSTRTIEYTKELLSTGSGRTTICEVVICPSESTFIEVVPASLKKVEEFLDEFCEITWQKVYPENSNNLEPLSTEVSRAVKHMVNLKDQYKNKVLIDTAEEFAKEFAKDEYEKFKQAILSRASLSLRTETILKFTPAEDSNLENEKQWIEKSFGDLNLVNLDNFPLPGQIKIHVSPSILDFSRYPFVKSIIDTRGLDIVKDRSDIETYVREHDEAICIFTDSFRSVPNSVAESFTRYLTKESRDIDTKLSLLVLPRKGEPEKVHGTSGEREEGIAVRKNQVKDILEGQNIKFIYENMFFYDPLLHYTTEQRLDPDIDIEWVEADKKQMFDEFAGIIERRTRKLINEAQVLESIFLNIINGSDLSPADERLIESLKKTLIGLRRLNTLNISISSGILSFLQGVYASQLNAINRRFGEYDQMDIYFEAKRIAEECSRKNFDKPKSKIDGAIQLAREQASELSGLQPIMELLEEKIDQIYEASIISLASKVSELLKKETLAPQDLENPFWYAVIRRWGSGEGFVRDVLNRYNSELNDSNTFFEQETLRVWEEDFMQVIFAFFGDGDDSPDDIPQVDK